MHEPLLIAPERLMVSCIFNSRLPSSFVDKVDIFTLELVLRGFVICLDTEEAHGDLHGEDNLSPIPYTKKKGVSSVAQLGDVRLPHSAHESSLLHLLPFFFKPS
jgi:hypothetical protein